MEEPTQKRPGHLLLYGWIIILIFSFVMVLVSLPRMREAFARSGMVELVREHREAQKRSGTQQVGRVVFPIPTAREGSVTFKSYEVPIKGSLPRHERVERLLEGPPAHALREGAITTIPRGTKLIGITVSSRIVFVDLSKEFVEEHDWDRDHSLRKEQLKRTLMQESGIRDVVILVEGARL